jgi:hypothetical protein
MKATLSKTVLFLPLFLCRITVSAQVFSNDDAAREANFVTRVVQLDEFIHRFNNDSSSAIRRYYLSHHRPWDKSREQLIRSLFNYSTQHWDSLQMDHFIRRATDPEQPDTLGFLRDHWYAEAVCQFLYHQDSVRATLILKIQLNQNGTAQWVIAGVKPHFKLEGMKISSENRGLKPEDVVAEGGLSAGGVKSAGRRKAPLPTIVTISNVNPRKRFIQPAANETYFAELERDFANKRRLADLFDPRFFEGRYSAPFYEAVLRDRIKFVAVKKLRYHYLQVHDWVFTVENFERASRNSGWLITSIRPANPNEQSDYVKKLIGE